MAPIKILIVDDHPIVRDGLKTMLELQEEVDVVATAGNSKEAIRYIRQTMPDVVLLDIYMPGLDGIETTRKIRDISEDIRVLLITSHPDEELVLKALRHGAHGFLLKDWETERIIRAIKDSIQGQIVVPDLVLESLSERLQEDKQQEYESETDHPDLSQIPWDQLSVSFSRQEKQILTLIWEGCKNEEVANRLFLSVGTIKNYISDLYKKLDVRNRPEVLELLDKKRIHGSRKTARNRKM